VINVLDFFIIYLNLITEIYQLLYKHGFVNEF